VEHDPYKLPAPSATNKRGTMPLIMSILHHTSKNKGPSCPATCTRRNVHIPEKGKNRFIIAYHHFLLLDSIAETAKDSKGHTYFSSKRWRATVCSLFSKEQL
jgi:hypothetical protein